MVKIKVINGKYLNQSGVIKQVFKAVYPNTETLYLILLDNNKLTLCNIDYIEIIE